MLPSFARRGRALQTACSLATRADAVPSRLQHTDGGGVRPEAAGTPAGTHWLDRYFPDTRPWLEAQNRRWWIEGVKGRCKEHVQLEGREKTITDYIEKAYQRFLERHRHRVTDGRSETHLQMACLVLATYKVLHPWVRNDDELLEMLRGHMGSATSPLLRTMLRASLYLRSTIFKQAAFTALAGMLKTVRMDLGSAFVSEFQQTESEACLQVTSCLYHDVFAEEGVPQLTACCCCSQDSMWFVDLEPHKVSYERTSWQGSGDPNCTMKLNRM